MIKPITCYQPELFIIEQLSHVHPWTESMLRDSFTENYEVYGWFDGEECLRGFYILQRVHDEITLMDLAVHPDAQGQGIGGRLIQHLQTLASNRQGILWLEVRASNQTALGLYARSGFTIAGRRKNYYPLNGGSEDAILMNWQSGA
ncbi:ribosomal protein S18-alanine N-acetyltransferase [Pseudidiomarina terrestris]|uniref:ribosomal protein S18-alanine N-acetyltransferase n=1 Tax=Pseudidiomarina terrestris TaxID=2820060 RepID=UPI0026592C09|nr:MULTISPECIES: ribosomal protein S18-alanine N-acetyltransferase [unclassified Pseudidiomarina]